MHKKNLHIINSKNLYNVATTMKLIKNKFFSFLFIFSCLFSFSNNELLMYLINLL